MMVRVECPFDGEIFRESGGGEMNQQNVDFGKVAIRVVQSAEKHHKY